MTPSHTHSASAEWSDTCEHPDCARDRRTCERCCRTGHVDGGSEAAPGDPESWTCDACVPRGHGRGCPCDDCRDDDREMRSDERARAYSWAHR